MNAKAAQIKTGKKTSQSWKSRIGSQTRSWQGGLVGAMVVIALLTVPRPATACAWYDPFCWVDEGIDFILDDVRGIL
jgi:hypothetical protein